VSETLADRPTALYRFYDPSAAPVYFGVAVSPEQRWLWHQNADWWPTVDHSQTRVDWYPNRAVALAAEKAAIQTERPQRNRAHADYLEPLGVSITDLRAQIAEVVNRTLVDGQITYLTSRGRRVAAIVPVRDGDEAVRRRSNPEGG
jgi:prevent-host-death family protein